MLIGEYKHTIDEKNRISLPVRFRSELSKKVIVTHGLDGCLFMYGAKEWKKISEKIGSLGMGQADRRGFNRFMLSGAFELDVDGSGRILIPENLRKFAQVDEKVVFAGVYNRVEIWNEKNWENYKAKTLQGADSMAEKLGEIGAI